MVRSSFITYLVDDVFSEITGISARAMFGGYGLYKDGIIFGLVVDDTVYLKVDEENLKDYEKIHSHPFQYEMKNHKTTTMSYWVLPDEIYEDKRQVEEWVEKSLAASKRMKQKKGKH